MFKNETNKTNKLNTDMVNFLQIIAFYTPSL